MNKLNPSLKHHTLIGVLLGVWGFLFAFFTRPFEHGVMDLRKWILVSVGFNVLAFLSYVAMAWIQKLVYDKRSSWNAGLEISAFFLFYLLFTLTTYVYYKSPIINGFYDLAEFFLKICVNTFLLITPILFIARRYSLKLIPPKVEYITIKGENKLDILKIKQTELVCISNAQNYVEIFFLENNQIKTKLIRTSLKKLQAEFGFLLQIHRSHLINPDHFKSWKDANTISLTQIDLPVSKNYKKRLPSL
ncbi:MAG: LytTR family DNA-binding domain-containing protein [Bacteroidota bacterium]